MPEWAWSILEVGVTGPRWHPILPIGLEGTYAIARHDPADPGNRHPGIGGDRLDSPSHFRRRGEAQFVVVATGGLQRMTARGLEGIAQCRRSRQRIEIHFRAQTAGGSTVSTAMKTAARVHRAASVPARPIMSCENSMAAYPR